MAERTSLSHLLLLGAILWLALPDEGAALKCRTDDGPSDAELKRISRACMRKVGDGTLASPHRDGSETPHQQHSYGQYGHGPSSYGHSSRYDYYDGEEDNEDGSNGFANAYMGYDRNEDPMRQRHRHRMQQQQRSRRSPTASSANDRGRASASSASARGSGASGSSGGSQRVKHNNNGGHKNSSGTESACVVHCFLEETNMLNGDGYPDRSKVHYTLTKNLRDRDLRNFYTDSIQECFQYLETLRRRDKCQVARELINCLTEYAKANCDDWQQFSMIFS